MVKKIMVIALVIIPLILLGYTVDLIKTLKNEKVTFQESSLIFKNIENNMLFTDEHINEKLESLTKTDYEKILSLKLLDKSNGKEIIQKKIINLNKEEPLQLNCYFKNPFCYLVEIWYHSHLRSS